MLCDKLVDKGIGPDQDGDYDRCKYGCGKEIHGIAVIRNCKDECQKIKTGEKDDAEDGKNAFSFFHNVPFFLLNDIKIL